MDFNIKLIKTGGFIVTNGICILVKLYFVPTQDKAKICNNQYRVFVQFGFVTTRPLFSI